MKNGDFNKITLENEEMGFNRDCKLKNNWWRTEIKFTTVRKSQICF